MSTQNLLIYFAGKTQSSWSLEQVADSEHLVLKVSSNIQDLWVEIF
jgi:hypothetical protein